MLIGILQEFRCAAVTRATWRQGVSATDTGGAVVVLPHLDEVFCLALRIEELVLMEEPQLKVLRHLFRGEW